MALSSAERSHRYDSRLKARGACLSCRAPRDRPGTLCAACVKKESARTSKFYNRLRDTGLCFVCRAPVERQGVHCKSCLPKLRVAAKSRADARRAAGLCGTCGAVCLAGYKQCQMCMESRRARHLKLKLRVMAAYGGLCACCGDTFVGRLTIDHVNNDGAVHRRTLKSQASMYQHLVNEGFPSGFQVLCASCNLAKHITGHCPH